MAKLSSKKWINLFLLTIALVLGLYALFNVLTDPFGVFGDKLFNWYSFDMTNNPRVSKIAYLDEHNSEYDSYIIGSSASSSIPTEELNQALGAKFFNMIMYGADSLDIKETAEYLIKNYEVKNLVLCTHALDAMNYDINSGKLTDIMHCKVDGSNKFNFYAKYLFADWRYGYNKIQKYINDSYVQASYDCFNAQTGAYDKSKRDVENIGDLSEYVKKDDYAIFTDYPKESYNIAHLDEYLSGMNEIKKLCDEKGINLLVICPPMYSEYLDYYYTSDLITFAKSLAEITDFWDFTNSTLSSDPRFFYDETHFRNALGQMAVAYIFQNTEKWMPQDFGLHITKETSVSELERYFANHIPDDSSYAVRLPILTYHETYEEQHEYGITTALFREHMKALKEAGFTAISFTDLKNYVDKGINLPKKPILITFDDGYLCNLEEAGPILEEYGFKATIFVIGTSFGKETYKETGIAMNPHFGVQEAKKWIDKGIFDIQSHGYNLHEVEGLDVDPIRIGVLPKDGETEEEYIELIRDDTKEMRKLLSSFNTNLSVMAYPYGKYTVLDEILYAEEGIFATVTTEAKTNVIIKGLPQSLRALGRYDMESYISAQDMLEMIK